MIRLEKRITKLENRLTMLENRLGIEQEAPATTEEIKQALLQEFKDNGFEMYKVDEIEKKLRGNEPQKGDWCKFWDDDTKEVELRKFGSNKKDNKFNFFDIKDVPWQNCERLPDSLQEQLNKYFK